MNDGGKQTLYNTYRTSLDKSDGMTVLYFAIIILLAVDLLNKSLKHFRRAIIVIAAYMEKAVTSDIYLFSIAHQVSRNVLQ